MLLKRSSQSREGVFVDGKPNVFRNIVQFVAAVVVGSLGAYDLLVIVLNRMPSDWYAIAARWQSAYPLLAYAVVGCFAVAVIAGMWHLLGFFSRMILSRERAAAASKPAQATSDQPRPRFEVTPLGRLVFGLIVAGVVTWRVLVR